MYTPVYDFSNDEYYAALMTSFGEDVTPADDRARRPHVARVTPSGGIDEKRCR